MRPEEISENFTVDVTRIGEIPKLITYQVMFISKETPSLGRLPIGKSLTLTIRRYEGDNTFGIIQAKPNGIATNPNEFQEAAFLAITEFERANPLPNQDEAE